MIIDKKQAARQAAAKYSTNPSTAFVEYGKRIGRIDQSFAFDKPNREYWETLYEISREMLELLPEYRHPAGDVFTEWMWFVDLSGPEMKIRMHEEPEFLKLLKNEGVPTYIIKAIQKYVHEAERAKLDLTECQHELQGFKEKFEDARWIYYEEKWTERSEKRNAPISPNDISAKITRLFCDVKNKLL
jgi:hypothetical protein